MKFLGSFPHEVLHFHFVLGPASYVDCHAKGLYLLEIEVTQHDETAEILIIQPFTEVNGKEHVKAAYRHPAYLTYMQSASCEMTDLMNHSWNQDCQDKYQKPQICR